MDEPPAQASGRASRTDAEWVAALIAVDPVRLGGVVLRASAGPARDAWLARLEALLPPGVGTRRVPLHIADDRLLGGLDLAATLKAGHVVAQRGLLASADGGLLLLAMAERLTAGAAARIAAVLDTGAVITERDGIALRSAVRVGVVALDEGLGDDEAASPRLRDRLAFQLELDATPAGEIRAPATLDRNDVESARDRLDRVTASDDLVEALCAAALALGIDSVRAPLLALRAACVVAALAHRDAVTPEDAALAARLVLAARATRLPAAAESDDADAAGDDVEAPDDEAEAGDDDAHAAGHAVEAPDDAVAPKERQDPSPPEATPPSSHSPPPPDADQDAAASPKLDADAADDLVLQAALAALPPHLLDALKSGATGAGPVAAAGRAGAVQAHASRGRPNGVRRGEPRGGARLNLIETLRAAAPWQAIRRREPGAARSARIQVRREDFHVTRYEQRSETTTVFVVDASGSSALHRLAEAKGAVELLLADCYVRRDSVAMISFRGRTAELLLPPTRSLARAKRSLAGLPGGGGTPLAAGLDAAVAIVDAVRRRGDLPVVVLLTDGKANVALDGTPGRALAGRDALASAQRLRSAGAAALLLDTSAQPQEAARQLAQAMGASYLLLPHAAARELSRAVREVTTEGRPPRR